MKVFLVTEEIPYEGDTHLGVFSTYEKAVEFLKKKGLIEERDLGYFRLPRLSNRYRHQSYDYFGVEELIVDDCNI